MVNEPARPLFKFRNKQRRLPPTPAIRLRGPPVPRPTRNSGSVGMNREPPGIDGKEFCGHTTVLATLRAERRLPDVQGDRMSKFGPALAAGGPVNVTGGNLTWVVIVAVIALLALAVAGW